MRYLFITSLMLFSTLCLAENPFAQFIGEYKVVDSDCVGTDPINEPLERLSIVKKSPRLTAGPSDPQDLFIEFYYEGYGSTSTRELNLSAFEKVTYESADGEAVWEPSSSQLFSLEKVANGEFTFFDFNKSSSFHDECTYYLELKK